ncbi:hypothetical protein COY14_02290 [Candidatus Roizmanbacteria bacterium CG_4_10_14_0_2_um_filter_36_9]|uniref:LysM domain-containing protein n=1 Tax=Candidatus Roizmanbacteria bacterium CG_4_10_14_0_2_um_filter_36_9 TaxID=1974823 RepID=A0A2M7U4A5_9BACT|nr:MAG: hypothetical protein COY14_02290 [Candidatus Roizmanbacteria bacterium CG_4_10_14_0_2_um_filter_36_9]
MNLEIALEMGRIGYGLNNLSGMNLKIDSRDQAGRNELFKKYGSRIGALFLAAILAGCGTGAADAGGGIKSESPSQPLKSSQDILCSTSVVVQPGDTLSGSVAKKARKICPNLSNQEIFWSTNDPNNIIPGQTLHFVDKRGY